MLAGRNLHYADYIVIAAMLIITLGIGIYHAVARGGNKTTADYFLGGRSQGVIPVSISLFASFISSILILGFPAEVYTNGGMFMLSSIGICLGAVLAAIVFVPVFYPLKLTSVNQYLRRRFDSRLIAYLGTIGGITGMMFYTGTVYYAPSTAIEAVNGFPTWASILVGSVITVSYTTIGGFKAVIWTDVFQALMMVGGLIAVTIQAVVKVGSLSEVWKLCNEWGRLELFDFSLDPTVRFSFWALLVGQGFGHLFIYGTSQTSVQRYCSLPTISKARWSVFGAVPWVVTMITFACIAGLTVFAYYTKIGCDPLEGGFISNPNQIIPHFVMDSLYYPGVPGILLAGLISGSLSSASSALNSSAAIIWDDIIVYRWPDIAPERKVPITKVIVVACGILSTGFGFMVSLLGGTVIQVISTFISSIGGPLSAVFILGVTVPFANWVGALCGIMCSFVFALWVGIGAYLNKKQNEFLPTLTDNCTAYASSILSPAIQSAINSSQANYETTTAILTPSTTLNYINTTSSEANGLEKLYSISYLWISPFSMFIGIIVGITVSLLTGGPKRRVPPELLHPIYEWLNPSSVDHKRRDQTENVNSPEKERYENPGFVEDREPYGIKTSDLMSNTKL